MIEARSFSKPDEVREFGHGKLELVKIGDRTVTLSTFEPGWRWSNDVKPIAGTDSCEIDHFGFVVAGRLHIQLNDGTTGEAGPGEVFTVPAGHDAWVVGDERCVLLDWSGDVSYAKR